MNKTIVVVRHGSARPDAATDAARRLTGTGRSEAGALGDALAGVVHPATCAFVSTAVRARETWDVLAGRLPAGTLEAAFTDELYDAGADAALEVLACAPEWARTAVVVGHNPCVADLARSLHDGSDSAAWAQFGRHGFPPGAAAVLAYGDDWRDVRGGSATMQWTWTPSGG